MPEDKIHLMKTLCAMRWIMMLNGNHAVAAAVQQDIDNLSE